MIGTVIGNYRIEREIGEGGMSHVFVGRTNAATEVLPKDFPIVLKVMSDELAGDATARKRFIKRPRNTSIVAPSSQPELACEITITTSGPSAWPNRFSNASPTEAELRYWFSI